MTFTASIVLFGLLALPAVFFLLRLTPPPAQRIRFPPLALLRGLPGSGRTPDGIPLWLLLLRLGAAALMILGLAGPTLHPPSLLPGSGPILLVVDNGWATAATWPARRAAAQNIIAAAQQAGRAVALFATAASAAAPAQLAAALPAAEAAQSLDALQPQPWPSDRLADKTALRGATETTRIYIADGITDGPGLSEFLEILAPSQIISDPQPPALLLSAQLTPSGSLAIHAINVPPGTGVSARTGVAVVLAHATFTPAGDAFITLPPPIANQVASLSLDGPSSAAATFLLDGSSRTVLAGLAAGAGNAEAPFLGALYFIRRALPVGTQILTGNPSTLLAAKPGLIILADVPLSPTQQAAAKAYISAGGVLLRFAGSITSATPNDLTPDPLLAGDRRLGGTLTWGTAQSLGPFPPGSPLIGLPTKSNARITRQVLADPTRLTPGTVWATLQDGTPLILGATLGKGYLISILTSASPDWSSLALSGLYPALLARLVALANGSRAQTNLALPLRLQLTAFGTFISPAAPTTAALREGCVATTFVSLVQPPGFYGDDANTVAFNLGGHIPRPVTALLPDPTPLTGAPLPQSLGAQLIAAALLLLTADLLFSTHWRGLLRLSIITALPLLLIIIPNAQAQPALQTSLGYISSGDATTNRLSYDGLEYLSTEVATHTSAALNDPVALDPTTDDLAFYPLVYWLVTASTPAPTRAACNTLNSYTQHGGLLVIDTVGGDPNAPGSGAGFSLGTNAALFRVTACLALPPLQPLNSADVLAHCFYILHDFSGRFTGAPVLIAAPSARDADGVSPVIIGQNDWAGAWARDSTGTPEQLPIPNGDTQRLSADRFGTNLVIYALTGSYKADQSALLSLLNKSP